MSISPTMLDVHTPFSSFSIVHSTTQDSLESLYSKLTRKVHNTYNGERVGPGWLKYEFGGTVWDLDDDSDYTIFVWRQQQLHPDPSRSPELGPSDPNAPVSSAATTISQTTTTTTTPRSPDSPVLHLHNPADPLPVPPEYQNTSYYVFHPSRQAHSHAHGHGRGRGSGSGAGAGGGRRAGESSSIHKKKGTGKSIRDRKSIKGKDKSGGTFMDDDDDEGVPTFKQAFDKFHSENGVRTVMGSIGPVKNVRMLLKPGYRHVYISRKFALQHGFIPADAAPGHYGYSGLVNIGVWPITLRGSSVESRAGGEGLPLMGSSIKGVGAGMGAGTGTGIGGGGGGGASISKGMGKLSLGPTAGAAAGGSSISSRGTAGAGADGTSPPSYTKKSKRASANSESSSLHHTSKPKPNPAVSSSASVIVSTPKAPKHSKSASAKATQPKPTLIQVYLSEEPHFDVVLGRSFIERRQIRLTSTDMTDVVCLDVDPPRGEKIECELVVLKDGRGEIVTVT